MLGYYVVGGSGRPLAELDAPAGTRGMTLLLHGGRGWQVWDCFLEPRDAAERAVAWAAEAGGASTNSRWSIC